MWLFIPVICSNGFPLPERVCCLQVGKKTELSFCGLVERQLSQKRFWIRRNLLLSCTGVFWTVWFCYEILPTLQRCRLAWRNFILQDDSELVTKNKTRHPWQQCPIKASGQRSHLVWGSFREALWKWSVDFPLKPGHPHSCFSTSKWLKPWSYDHCLAVC